MAYKGLVNSIDKLSEKVLIACMHRKPSFNSDDGGHNTAEMQHQGLWLEDEMHAKVCGAGH